MYPMFDFKNLSITKEDIAFIESRFGFNFNEGQKKIIRFWDTTDIQACPGSGKTTTLAAKLIILANKIPKSFKQGICVITHTNVAVEEIKSKLGSYSNFFFRYPNHFGTIQSFVDKFLSIPAYKNEFKYCPVIDNESYCYLIERAKNQDIEKAKHYLSTNKGIEFLGKLSFNRINFDISIDVNESEPIVGKHTPTYNTLLNLKNAILKKGYIKYEEAYSIAFKYLRESPQLVELFSRRFPLVLIDEMQDMETHQSELISCLFDGSPAIVQKIGDINQSIYNYSSSDRQNEWLPKINLELQLTETTRISENIVKIVKDICLSPQEMAGWTNSTPLIPTIIVYDDNSILNVKDKFGELLILNRIHQGRVCKAVGARLSGDKLNINSYWHEFNRRVSKKDFTNIILFIEDTKQLSTQTKNVKEVRKSFLNILCKCLRLCKIKNPLVGVYFTSFTLVHYLNSLEDARLSREMNDHISRWIVSISNTEILKNEIEKYTSTLITLFGGVETQELRQFFITSEIESAIEKTENKIYTFPKDEHEVQIHFDTIHGVKSETHQATLYLETFNRIYDIGSKILEFIISNEKQKTRMRADNAFKKRLPLAYVAMTRATHFICLAVHKDRFTDNHKAYFEGSADWDVIYL